MINKSFKENIGGFLGTTLIDFPNEIASIIFLNGCNYRCYYCHNSGLLENLSNYNYCDIINKLSKRVGTLTGVVVSGGEPTLYSDIINLFKVLKDIGYKTKLDTNGSNPNLLKRLIKNKLIDYVAIDYKAPSYLYKSICNVPESLVRYVNESIKLMVDSFIDFEVRTTVVPEIKKEDIIFMASEFPVVPKYVLKSHRNGDNNLINKNNTPYTKEELMNFAKEIIDIQPNTIVI